MINNGKISIVITCYNDATYLKEAVASALDQTYANKEVILVDDGSDAKTKAVIEEMRSQLDKVITQENKGVSSARNTGISIATGEFILVLDSDDYFEPQFCEKAVEIFLKEDRVKVVTCHARWFKNSQEYQIFHPTGGDIENFLRYNATLSNSLYRKIDWESVGGYDENMLKGFEDWEFYIRMHQNGGITWVIQEVLFHYRKREESKTTIANRNKYHLLKYIYIKHADLYKAHFPLFIEHLLNKVEKEENEKLKNLNRKEYKIGLLLLRPLRWWLSKNNKRRGK